MLALPRCMHAIGPAMHLTMRCFPQSTTPHNVSLAHIQETPRQLHTRVDGQVPTTHSSPVLNVQLLEKVHQVGVRSKEDVQTCLVPVAILVLPCSHLHQDVTVQR